MRLYKNKGLGVDLFRPKKMKEYEEQKYRIIEHLAYLNRKIVLGIRSESELSEKMKELNEKKAKILYDYLDESKLFVGTVVKEDRSLMNVPFVCDIADKEKKDEIEAKFIKEATEAGFVNLKGHRTVGGMRASIYNAMPIEGVEKLVEFMKKFEKENA